MNEVKAPKGTRDIFYPEISKWQFLEAAIRDYFARFLFREIRTPIFEHSELFTRSIGTDTEVVQKEMYTFQDKAQRDLTLRPENTAGVIRALLENNLLEAVFPLKFFYIGPMFRYDKPQKGRYRQFHQFGVEVLGEENPLTDCEVVFSAFDFLQRLGIKSIQLQLNSVGCRQCRPAYRQVLQQAVQSRLADLCHDCRDKTGTNPMRIFDCKVPGCQEISAGFPVITDMLCPDCRDHFQKVQQGLKMTGTPFVINSRLVRGLDYYTKTAFEITSEQLGAQNAILGGGRYDDLVQELGGPEMAGIGFAAGMERIVLHLDQPRLDMGNAVFVIHQSEAQLEAAWLLLLRLWREGIAAMMDYQPRHLKKQFKKADRVEARYALILGEEELRRHTVSVKDMKNQQQVTIPAEEVIPWLKQRV